MILLNENLRYVLQDEAVVEDFDDGSLVFLAEQKRLIEINLSARRILRLLNRRRNLRQVIAKATRDFHVHENMARNDIQRLVLDFGEKMIVKPLVKITLRRRRKMDKSAALLANPRISLREEEDGAILFNAEMNGLQIINPIGLLIWKYIQVHPRTRNDISSYLMEVCEDVPAEKVGQDVDSFVSELQGKGFIGEVLNEKR